MTISIYLQGGLGNQMFQYATAKALAEHYKVSLSIDSSWYIYPPPGVTKRNLDLNYLNISCKNITSSIPTKGKSKLALLLGSYLPFGPIVNVQRNAFNFNKALFCQQSLQRRDLKLIGYWQSYKYFDKIRPILINEFQMRESISPHYLAYLKNIRSCESVMLHIRRGDYVNSPSAAKFHEALSIGYYKQAIEALLLQKPSAHFFIFSDDLSWAKEALPKNLEITFVENSLQVDAAAQELQLMTQCKHHIIANSSLSWWGAWLKQDYKGLVYAPNRWISDRSLDLSNLLPTSWNRIPA